MNLEVHSTEETNLCHTKAPDIIARLPAIMKPPRNITRRRESTMKQATTKRAPITHKSRTAMPLHGEHHSAEAGKHHADEHGSTPKS